MVAKISGRRITIWRGGVPYKVLKSVPKTFAEGNFHAGDWRDDDMLEFETARGVVAVIRHKDGGPARIKEFFEGSGDG